MLDNKKEFEKYKGDYNKIEMSEEAYRKMCMRMEQAKAEKKSTEKKNRLRSLRGTAVAVAAALMIVILPNTSPVMAQTMGNIPVLGDFFRLVTVRTFHYEDGSKSADVTISEITTGDSTENADAKRELSAKQINDEIKAISDKLLSEFKDNLEKKGFHDINIKAVTTATTDRYFTVEVIAYEAQADGYEERHYYTIDLITGDRVELKDLFEPDSDYQKAIAGCIENQMREQMKADESIIYWIDDGLIDLNLAEMVNEAEFYINDKNELVISFDETEVGPASMGVVEFTIERAQLADILK